MAYLHNRGTVRRATLNGRSYLVAPTTLLVPGVLDGSLGPLYYPPEGVSRDPSVWNGKPLTLGHPMVQSQQVSATSSRAVANRFIIGHVDGVRFAGGKLIGMAWFDEERTRQRDPGVLVRLQRGKPIEVSTGLYTDLEPAPAGAAHNGRPYLGIVRRFIADHLAVLPDSLGACSIADGCGILNRQENTMKHRRFVTGCRRVRNQDEEIVHPTEKVYDWPALAAALELEVDDSDPVAFRNALAAGLQAALTAITGDSPRSRLNRAVQARIKATRAAAKGAAPAPAGNRRQVTDAELAAFIRRESARLERAAVRNRREAAVDREEIEAMIPPVMNFRDDDDDVFQARSRVFDVDSLSEVEAMTPPFFNEHTGEWSRAPRPERPPTIFG